MKKRKPTLGFFLKALVSLGLLVFLLSQLDLAQFWRIVSSAHLSHLGVAIGAYFVGKMITSARWALLARPLGFRNPFKEFAVFYFVGMFFNLFAPSTLGGDAGRVFYLCRGATKTRQNGWKALLSRALISVATDRAVGLAVLLWIGAGALLAFPEYADAVPWMARYSIFLIASGSFFLVWFLPLASSSLQRLRQPWGEKLKETLHLYAANYRLILQVVLLSLTIHLIQTWIQILLGRAIDLDIPWTYCLIFFPLVDILSMLPISFSGIGLREGGYFFFLGKLGIGPEAAVACGVLWFVVVLFNGLIGGVLFLLYRRDSLALAETKP